MAKQTKKTSAKKESSKKEKFVPPTKVVAKKEKEEAPKEKRKYTKKADVKPEPEKTVETPNKVVDKAEPTPKTTTDTAKMPEVPKQEGILPVGEEKTKKETPKKPDTTPPPADNKKEAVAEKKAEPAKKSKYYSDKVYEIQTEVVVFIGCITANKGLKFHRVEEQKYILSGIETDTVTNESKPFEYIFPDDLADEDKALLPPSWWDLLQNELNIYETRLKEEKLKPKPKAGVDAPPAHNLPNVPVSYTTSGVEDMEAYGDLIYSTMMKNPAVVNHGFKYPAIEVEKNLKKESTLYKFELKFDQKERAWYIDMSQGTNVIRVPKDKTKFLPIK